MAAEIKNVSMLYGRACMDLNLPASATILEGKNIPALSRPEEAISEALSNPIGSLPLCELLAEKKPKTVAITISDITRPKFWTADD